MPIKNKLENLNWNEAVEAIIEEVRDLLAKQGDRILNLTASSEDNTAKLSIPVTIDCSESEPLITVEIGFGQRYKDKRQRTLGNPNQPALFDRENQPAVDVERNGQAETNGEHDGNGKVVTFDQVVQAKKRGRKAKPADVTESAAE